MDRWDQWVHAPSGRCYHVIRHPPKSMIGIYPTEDNMLDDETGEKLVKVNIIELFLLFVFIVVFV